MDGAAEEGTPYIPAHGTRRIAFTPGPADCASITRTIAPAPILPPGSTAARSDPSTSSPRHEPGHYDREVFLVLKEFEPTFSRGGDMAMDFLLAGDAGDRL